MSTIIPVLNRVATIEICLESVASQSYPAVEHIVVDGGSTDETTKVIEAPSQRHPVTWIRQRDMGMYGAVNKGPSVTRRKASEARVQLVTSSIPVNAWAA